MACKVSHRFAPSFSKILRPAGTASGAAGIDRRAGILQRACRESGFESLKAMASQVTKPVHLSLSVAAPPGGQCPPPPCGQRPT
ncbi:hypothetical protein Hsar01_00379 [Haloferula sargassicola]|uniref:Uncharacterized protein n=1 Tax=Haloferula sargassicola TaxID=490096 RepID=A0ABP9UKF2_9BACT